MTKLHLGIAISAFATVLGLIDIFSHYISDTITQWLCEHDKAQRLTQISSCSTNVDIQLLVLFLLLLLLGSVLIAWSAISEPNIDW